MCAIFRIALIGFAFLAGLTIVGRAEPPPVRVLLLDNERILQGEIDRVGEQYRVRRDGGETFIPANRVLTACSSLESAYQFLEKRVGPTDADGHVRLARWCDINGMRKQAAAEAKIAADLAPNRSVVQAVYRQMQRKAEAPAPQSAPARLPKGLLTSTAIEPVESDAESYKRFATKVQPILMNTCANCHVGELTKKFQLERVFAEDLNSQAVTYRNLTVAMSAIDRTQPANSPILQRATTAHGGAVMPPLRDRGVPAYKQLEEWVKIAAGNSPVTPAISTTPPSEPPASSTAIAPASDAKSEFGAGVPKKEVIEGPRDPFDPVIFNQQHHPNPPKSGDTPPPTPKP